MGLSQEDDLRRIGLMHDALATSGKKPLLMIDSNEYWSPKQAIRHIQEIEEQFDLFWVEEPARRWDYRGLRKVSESVRAAVATGENLNDISEFMALVANEAADVIQVGVGTSGITGAMMVAEMAYGFEIPVSLMNCPANYMAHLAAVLPNHNMMEVLDAGGDQGMIHRHTVQDGYVVLSDDPGIGITFDEAKLNAWAIDKPSARVTMPFARRRGAGLFQVPVRDRLRAGQVVTRRNRIIDGNNASTTTTATPCPCRNPLLHPMSLAAPLGLDGAGVADHL